VLYGNTQTDSVNNSFSKILIQLISPTFLTPEENLACDEAMLDFAEESSHPGFLRFFESPRYFVVLGYGKKIAEEVFENACRARDIPVLRRCSGGGTVLQGPGCLNFCLVLPTDSLSGLDTITGANRLIMERHRACFERILNTQVEVQGISDLTISGVKFSGNAQRRKKRCLLFHGSFLLNLDLEFVSEVLRPPIHQPVYRAHREHRAFLRNIAVSSESILRALVDSWNAEHAKTPHNIEDLTAQLVKTKYSTADWNRKF
jgi:lipoate---protein ligase